MIFENCELYNIEQLEKGKYGYRPMRLKTEFADDTGEFIKNDNNYAICGAEIRFVLLGGSACIKIYNTNDDKNAFDPLVRFDGDFQVGWQSKQVYNLSSGLNEIVIEPPKEYDDYLKVYKELGHTFHPSVVRLFMPGAKTLEIVEIRGDICPPKADQTPKTQMCIFGSSITHGSMALLPNTVYPAILARKLKCNIRNLGFAGSCYIDKGVADHIAALPECDLLISELGTNCYSYITDEEFLRRTDYLINTYYNAHPKGKMIIIDTFRMDSTADGCREMVKKFYENNKNKYKDFYYLCGKDILKTYLNVTGDFIHPSTDGQNKIAEELYNFITAKKLLCSK